MKKNAYLITKLSVLYNNLYKLLTLFIFADDLCFFQIISQQPNDESNILNFTNVDLQTFKFFKCKLNQKKYYTKFLSKISNYTLFVRSAFIYYLECNVKKHTLSNFMFLFTQIVGLNKFLSIVFYKDMKYLNIFYRYPIQSLNGFLLNILIFVLCIIIFLRQKMIF